MNFCVINKGGCLDICVLYLGDNFFCMCFDGLGKFLVNKMC